MTTTQDDTLDTTDVGSQLTAENMAVEVAGDSFAYRRFGNTWATALPLLCLQHFRGNLDSWDPELVDRIAGRREVILLANRGVGSSTGVVPDNVRDMTRDALHFIDALGLKRLDVLGFASRERTPGRPSATHPPISRAATRSWRRLPSGASPIRQS
jgi:pimeloyl-ACP methyl ester carboxylesterase